MFVALSLALAASSVAQQIKPAPSISAADVDFWLAALKQIRSEQGSRVLALLNETLPSAEFRGHLRNKLGERETVLVDKALARNTSTVSIPSSLQLAIELVEAKSVRKAGSSEFDIDVLGRRFGQQGGRLVRLSLPVFSDDGTRALVFSELAGGFDDFEGRAYVFERKQGEWIVVDYLYLWIT
jgi:hypothetical protein